uniref:Bm9464 n=1 Tax=Brugia malayi TaxID=6279 RepID=A0A0H5S5S6_BRUMA|nr:Bm9464 [Brugia malayi]
MLWVDEFVIIWGKLMSSLYHLNAFAVLAPIGPLRRISGKAHEYSDQVTSVRLGMGDFIFYSLLVDKASATRSTMCVADSMAGWLAGILTLAVLSSYDEPTTALSVPIDYHRCTATFRHLSVRRTIP